MDFTDLYYQIKWGKYPFNSYKNYDKTHAFISYLKDNNFSNNEIFTIVEEAERKNYLSISDVKEKWWDGYLTNKEEFYYHGSLRLQPKKPMWNPVTEEVKIPKFYLEMRIKYSIEDLLSYYYIILNIPVPLRDKKRDLASLEYLIRKYSSFSEISSLDFVLHLIDFNKKANRFISNPLDISKEEANVLEHFEMIIQESKALGLDKVIWREA